MHLKNITRKDNNNLFLFKKIINTHSGILGAFIVFNFFIGTFIIGAISLNTHIKHSINWNINALDILFFITLTITGIISFIYFTENKRLKKREEHKRIREKSSKDKIFKKINRNTFFLSITLPPLLLIAPMANKSFLTYIEIYFNTLGIYAISALLFLKHAKKKKWFDIRPFFYGGGVLGLTSGIVVFITSAFLSSHFPDSTNNGIKMTMVISLIAGWYLGPFFMTIFWAFVVNQNLKPRIISCLLFLVFAVGPVWAIILH